MQDILLEDPFIERCHYLSVGEAPLLIHVLNYKFEAYHTGLYDYFRILKPNNISTWLPQRCSQFLAGRLAAKKAMLTLPCSDSAIFIGKHREPIWPAGIIGSISHSEQTSIAAIKQKQNAKSGLGIDLQSIIDTETQRNIAPRVVSKNEYTLIKNSVHRLSGSTLFTLIFSAKESFFKAAFNHIGEYFDFDTVEVVNIDDYKSQLTLKVVKTLGNKLPKHLEIKVPFAILGVTAPQVITACNWELYTIKQGR